MTKLLEIPSRVSRFHFLVLRNVLIFSLSASPVRQSKAKLFRFVSSEYEMASILTAVLKASIGLLFNKGRDSAAEKLKEGDVTEQQFRNIIVREIDDIKSKLDGLSRKDLLTSISIFKEGIVFLYKVLDMTSSGEEGSATEQGTVTQGTWEGTSQLSLRSLETGVKVSHVMDIESLDDAGKRVLADAKKRFDEARMKATEAFNNVALSTTDRILAMQYRVMSTILEKIDNPKEAIAACILCLEELHSMPAVIKSFKVETTGGFLSWFNKEEREQVIQSVRDVNSVVLRVTKVADGILSRELEAWPCVNIEEKKVNPSTRLGENFFQSCVFPRSFGQKGEEDHRLKRPHGITTNSKSQFIVADNSAIKMFDCSGKFMLSLSSVFDGIGDVATDRDDNIYAMTFSSLIIVFDKEGKLDRFFGVRPIEYRGISVTVNGNQKVFVLMEHFQNGKASYRVAVHQADGTIVKYFSVLQFGRKPTCITCGSENRVMVWNSDESYNYGNCHLIDVFDAEGNHLSYLRLRVFSLLPVRVMAFHLSTEYFLIPSLNHDGALNIQICTKDDLEHVRNLRIEIYNICSVSGITVTADGRIVVLCTTKETQKNSEKHLVLVE